MPYKDPEKQRAAMLKIYYKNQGARKRSMAEYHRKTRVQKAARQRAYYKTVEGRAAILRAQEKYRSKNPTRVKAWGSAQIIELQACEVCGATERIHRHHPDENEPFNIVFLCPLHHRQTHTGELFQK